MPTIVDESNGPVRVVYVSGDSWFIWCVKWMLSLIGLMALFGVCCFVGILLFTFVSMIPNTVYEMVVELPRNVSIHYFNKWVGKQKVLHLQEEVVVTPIVPYNPDIRIVWTPYTETSVPRLNVSEYEEKLRDGINFGYGFSLTVLSWIRQNAYTSTVVGLFLIWLLATIYGSRVFAARKIREVVWWARGIKYEAMMAGSNFCKTGSMPACQVEIYSAGTFIDTFVGYGVRMRDTLVIPHHNYVAVQNLGGSFMVKTKRGSLILNEAPEISAQLQDIAYYQLTFDMWSNLGVSKPIIPQEPEPTRVSCFGPRGTSTGALQFTEYVGIWHYSGSTIPGMSGSAYMANNTCVGIHNGVAGEMNLGVMSVAIDIEITALMYPEAQPTAPIIIDPEMAKKKTYRLAPTEYQKDKKKIVTGDFYSKAEVTRENLAKAMNVLKGKGAWANEAYVESAIKCVLNLPPQKLQQLMPTIAQKAEVPVTMIGQTVEPVAVSMVNTNSKVLDMRVSALEEKVKNLEDRLQRVTSGKQIRYVYCEFPGCKARKGGRRRFKCDEDLLAHKVAVNHMESEVSIPKVKISYEKQPDGRILFKTSDNKVKAVKVESAFDEDNATKETLGFQKTQSSKIASQKTTLKPLTNRFTVLEKTEASTSTQVNQQNLEDTLKKMQQNLEALVQTMAGLSSAIMPK